MNRLIRFIKELPILWKIIGEGKLLMPMPNLSYEQLEFIQTAVQACKNNGGKAPYNVYGWMKDPYVKDGAIHSGPCCKEGDTVNNKMNGKLKLDVNKPLLRVDKNGKAYYVTFNQRSVNEINAAIEKWLADKGCNYIPPISVEIKEGYESHEIGRSGEHGCDNNKCSEK